MKKIALSILITILVASTMNAQVGISTDGSSADPSAILDAKSITKGFLPPRMTAGQIATIVNPANGLMVFCTTDSKVYVFLSSQMLWKELSYGTATIAQQPICGNSILVNHVAGSVAPVTKSVIYGTVTGIPGESLKCWITSNLGATQQATAVSDATEASAGWYWQFNRKQGYKHDGTVTTPAWTGAIVSENSEWTVTNDPCSIELGNAWRIPTQTEWTNVDASTGGNWTTWTDPWNSGLKLHSAGYINYSNAAMWMRGVNAYYWSSNQISPTTSGILGFANGSCAVYGENKTYGFSIRCVRE